MKMKMKRKDLEDVYDDFSDFSLSSPARKIRRLDAELPPIIEEAEGITGSSLDLDTQLEEESVNEERALVLYKPVNSSVSPNVSISVNPDLISGFKSHRDCRLMAELFHVDGVFWAGRHHLSKSAEDELANNDCLAVVPWVSNPLSSAQAQAVAPNGQADSSERMEAEDPDPDGGAMDIEEDYSVSGGVNQAGTTYGSEGVLSQWQQQHCLTPQVPPNTATTPIMWSW